MSYTWWMLNKYLLNELMKNKLTFLFLDKLLRTFGLFSYL